MKNVLIALFLIAPMLAHAQTPPARNFGVGLELGAPTNSIYNIGFGGSGKAEISIAAPLSLSITAGYTSFYYKSALIGSNSSQPPAGFVPLKAGAKYYFGPGIYIEAEGGTAIETNYNKDKLFAYAVGPGFIIPTGKHTGVDLGFRYENWGGGRLRQTGIRIAYRIGW